MQLIRRSLIVISVCSSLLVMYISAILLAAFSISSYPISAALLIPWTSGIFGIAGLIRSWPDAATKSAVNLRKNTVLLGLGIIGAMLVGAIWLVILASNGAGATATDLALSFMFAAFFPLIPIGLASVEIYTSVIFLRINKLSRNVKMRNFYLVLLLVWLSVVAARVLAQEAIMMWYGRDLVTATYQAADKLAKGRPYCVMGFGGVDTFEEMDKRELLLSAIHKRMSSRNGTTNPHFGISFEDEVYWWSFKRREFLPLHAFSSNEYLPGRLCGAPKPSPQ